MMGRGELGFDGDFVHSKKRSFLLRFSVLFLPAFRGTSEKFGPEPGGSVEKYITCGLRGHLFFDSQEPPPEVVACFNAAGSRVKTRRRDSA
jgi:hypothetical protein